MSRTTFRLSSVLELRQRARDQRREQLAEALRAEAILAERSQNLEKELAGNQAHKRRLAVCGRFDVDRLIEMARYEAVLRGQLAAIRGQAAQLAAEVERRRQALVAADRDLRVVQKLRDRHERRQRAEAERREAIVLDDIAAGIPDREEEP